MDYSSHLVFLILCSQCVAVNIKRLEVPALVEYGAESVILDCEFNTSATPKAGLVMKWFFNGSSGLVYQWIPPNRPQVIGLLKGKVDLNFRISGYRDKEGLLFSDGTKEASLYIKLIHAHPHLYHSKLCIIEEPLQAYRALKILNPSTDLSGNYTCVVSTYMEEDRQTRPMLVYSSGKKFHFYQEKKYVFLVTLICTAEDLYPRPVMTILSKGMPLEQAKSDIKMDSWGLYSVTTTAVVHDDDVISPWEEFVCVLNLPPAGYSANRTTVYYPGLMPTAYIAAVEMEKHQERQANSCRGFVYQMPFLLYLILSLWSIINTL